MEKPAPVARPIEPLLQRRWSPRAFSDKPVEREALLRLFEATRWAPSSYNEQPWRYVVVTRENPDRLEARFKESMEAEKEKAKLLERKFKELLKKAKDEPVSRPTREIDLD